MYKRFKEKIKIKLQFEAVLQQIETIAKTNKIINLCAAPTGYSWLGVRNAGLSLFPENTVEIPQYYSNQVLSNEQLIEIGSLIGRLKFEQLIFNGFNDYFIIIIRNAKKVNQKVRVGSIHHGFPAELTENPVGIRLFKSMIEAYKNKEVNKIGFAKKGYSQLIHHFLGGNTFDIIYKNPILENNELLEKRIGVLTSNTFRKNTYTQIMAALSLKEYEVAISTPVDLEFFDSNNLLKPLGHLEHKRFLEEMSKNVINSHVTFSEASGGQVFTESLALGVPCLTSLTHGYLDDSEELKKALVVERFDDAWAIAQKMRDVISDRDHLSKLGLSYSNEMNKKADIFLKQFLEA